MIYLLALLSALVAGCSASPLPTQPATITTTRSQPRSTPAPLNSAPAQLSEEPEPGSAPVVASALLPAPPVPLGKRSSQLPSGFFNPMPGGQLAGYRIDTGLDIAGLPSDVYAIAAGTFDYSEPGHTRWVGPNDTANCIRMRLDHPIPWKGRHITHVWYAHLSSLRWIQAEGAMRRIHVDGGESIGISGRARGLPHLHLGLLLDGEVDQSWGTYLLEDEIREVLGPFKNFARLPK